MSKRATDREVRARLRGAPGVDVRILPAVPAAGGCPRCAGFLARDQDGDRSCVRCGHVVVTFRPPTTGWPSKVVKRRRGIRNGG